MDANTAKKTHLRTFHKDDIVSYFFPRTGQPRIHVDTILVQTLGGRGRFVERITQVFVVRFVVEGVGVDEAAVVYFMAGDVSVFDALIAALRTLEIGGVSDDVFGVYF